MKKLFFSLVACLFFSVVCFAEKTFFIAGKIEIPNDVSYTSIVVDISGTSDVQVKPDRKGNFIAEGLPAGGSYTISVILPGYKAVPETRIVDELSKNIMYEDFSLKKLSEERYTIKKNKSNKETGFEDDIDDIDMIDLNNKKQKNKENDVKKGKSKNTKAVPAKAKKATASSADKNKVLTKSNETKNKAVAKKDDLFDDDINLDDEDILSEQDVFEPKKKDNASAKKDDLFDDDFEDDDLFNEDLLTTKKNNVSKKIEKNKKQAEKAVKKADDTMTDAVDDLDLLSDEDDLLSTPKELSKEEKKKLEKEKKEAEKKAKKEAKEAEKKAKKEAKEAEKKAKKEAKEAKKTGKTATDKIDENLDLLDDDLFDEDLNQVKTGAKNKASKSKANFDDDNFDDDLLGELDDVDKTLDKTKKSKKLKLADAEAKQRAMLEAKQVDSELNDDLAYEDSIEKEEEVESDFVSISGRVLKGKDGVKDIKLNLVGLSKPATTTTDSSGFYKFDKLPAGKDYVVAVVKGKQNLKISPMSKVNKKLAKDVRNQNFYVVNNNTTKSATTTNKATKTTKKAVASKTTTAKKAATTTSSAKKATATTPKKVATSAKKTTNDAVKKTSAAKKTATKKNGSKLMDK